MLKRGIPAWLDVKDLRPGVFWNRDLEAALDAASCLLLLASPESMKSPNVRAEWERGKRQGKRIIVMLFRRVKLPDELSDCEIVDFRGVFTFALNRLVECVQGQRSATGGVRPSRLSVALPPWIFAIALALFVSLGGYFLLADWQMHASGPFRILLLALLPAMVLLLAWALCFSFLRRRMGMTHLLTCFAFGGAWTCYPFILYAVEGPASVVNYAQPIVQAIAQHGSWMLLLSALPVAGIGILLVVQPEDLLRWTPTGKAWGWFRERRTPRIPALDDSPSIKIEGPFYLLHDPLDEPAAAHLRRELVQSGAKEAAAQLNEGTAVLLLTNRTRTQWLQQGSKQVSPDMLTVVGSSIRVLPELDWLWQREWIDFRHWNLDRLNRRRGLLRVPEAVSGVRFPFPVRLAHHLLCAMLALSLLLVNLADPTFGENSPNSADLSNQNIAAVLVLGLWIWYMPLARRLLRRNISERAFYRLWPVALAAVCLGALWSFHQPMIAGRLNALRILPVAAFLIAWPILLLRNRPKLAFWFPASQTGGSTGSPNLACKRNWQTLLWISVYFAIWDVVLGLYRN